MPRATGASLPTGNVQDVPLDIARGIVPGTSAVVGFGKVTYLGPVTGRDLWPVSTEQVPDLLTSGVTMTLQSSSAQDAVGGPGVQSVNVIAIRGNGVQEIIPLNLNGATPVNVMDVRFIQCLHSTNGAAAVGNITVTYSGLTYAIIPAGLNRCLSSARVVPAGKVLLVSDINVSAVSGSGAARVDGFLVADVVLTTRYPGIYFPRASFAVQDGSSTQRFSPPMWLPELSVVKFVVTTDKTATVSGSWTGHFEDAA